MLTQAAVAEGEDSGTPNESQPTPSPTQTSAGDQPPLTESSSDYDSSQDPRVDLEGIGGSRGDQVTLPHDSPLSGSYTSDRAESSLNLEAFYALCNNLSNRGRKNAKSGPTKDGSDRLDVELDEDMEYIDTKEVLNEGRQSTVDTARPDVSTARQELSTVGPTTSPTTTTIFDDEEMTLSNTLIKLKDDKAKGVLEEPESAKKMTKSDFDATRIAKDEEIARHLEVELQAKVERERQGEEQASMNYNASLYNEVHGLYTKEQELIADFIPIGSEEDERMIRDTNKKAKEESSNKERRYPLTKRTLEMMMSLRLIIESAGDAAYDLPRFIQNKELASPKQTALGKDNSNR
nr:hypothetical protein [Tanacetum cinerariifolium]